MGLLDRFRRLVPAVAPNGQPVVYRRFSDVADSAVLNLSVEELWRTQPYLRTVVTFLARNIAQLGLQSFERVSETDRRRNRDDALPLLLSNPNGRLTAYELVYGLVADLALYDEAIWWVQPDPASASGWAIQPIPPSWVTARGGGSLFEVAWYDVSPNAGFSDPLAPGSVQSQRINANDLLVFKGWNPDDMTSGSSPVDALKQILAEQIHAQAYRQQLWERGGRVGAVLTRPSGAEWSEGARDRFAKDWKAKWSGDDGPKAGGTPILEDGMTLQRIGFSAHEDEWVEAAKLSLSLVASTYHLNPTMVGVLDNANYSNVREFRRMLYGDSLGPTMAMIEDRINAFLVPRVTQTSSLYVEFNIGEKLQGSFEEQALAMQSSTGAPWMLRSEARARMNLPEILGADELVVPMNVLTGGQASALDSGSQNATGTASAPPHLTLVKGRAPSTHETKYDQVVSAFFFRQAAVVKSKLGAKAAGDWWDGARWDAELTDDLYKLAVHTSKTVAASVLDHIGVSPDRYNVDQTLAFLGAVSARQATGINITTKTQLDDALLADDPAAAVSGVFEKAQTSRASQIATTALTAVSGFATTEAAKQVGGSDVTKTWVTGPNPRASHASMSGETVPIDDTFSNGLAWPGDGGDVSEVAGCNCSVDINY